MATIGAGGFVVNIIEECNLDARTFETTKEVSVAGDHCMYFANDSGYINETVIASFTGEYWADIVASILRIDGVRAIEVRRWAMTIYKNPELLWDYIEQATLRYLPITQ